MLTWSFFIFQIEEGRPDELDVAVGGASIDAEGEDPRSGDADKLDPMVQRTLADCEVETFSIFLARSKSGGE